MLSVKQNTSIKEYQGFIQKVYGLPNDRHFSTEDMLTNIERFTMRGIKGIRKKDVKKTTLNLLIAQSWFMSLMNQLHIDIEKGIWERFPYMCSYCRGCPCSCKEKGVKLRKRAVRGTENPPKTLAGFQEMFGKIYPPEKRSTEDAGIHLAEEVGELSEAMLEYKGLREEQNFIKITEEAADFFSCLMGVHNSLGISVAEELSKLFNKNCHACKKAPCKCSFTYVINFNS